MMHGLPIRLLCLLLFIPLCGRSAQNGEQSSPADSVLLSYYHTCRAHATEPVVLKMCDTLYERASAADNQLLQVASIGVRLDYYYYNNDSKHIDEYARRVCDFCRACGKPEKLLPAYYLAWGGRLINSYIKRNCYNRAVYEMQKMLAEAKADNYVPGIISSHRMLANLYLSQQTYERAYENFHRCISVAEDNGYDDVNLSAQYAAMAQCAVKLGKVDTAFMALHKCQELKPRRAYPRFLYCGAAVNCYLEIKDFETARKYLDSARMCFARDSSMRISRPTLYRFENSFYKRTGQYDKALAGLLRAESNPSLMEVGEDNMWLRYEIGENYYLKGDMPKAAAYFRKFALLADSLHLQEVRSATDNLSNFLEIERLQDEKQTLQLDMQRRQLTDTYIAIAVLALIALAAGLLSVRTMRLNRRLKASEATVVAQNVHLTEVGRELRIAKNRVEQASRIKSDFIQSMSHEVRTPLNSIVGFSQVLAARYHSEETAEYASIIETNSQSLLRLFDGVLDIALLDQTGVLPCEDYVRLNDVCCDCAERIRIHLRSGVSLSVELSEQDPTVCTNQKRVVQVLEHLLLNAAKFTESGSILLKYECRVDEGKLCFSVTDTGPGIPEDKCNQVFERFVKLDAFSQGTGLGLPICRIIAEKMNGSLDVDRTYTTGCRMVLILPFGEAGQPGVETA